MYGVGSVQHAPCDSDIAISDGRFGRMLDPAIFVYIGNVILRVDIVALPKIRL